MAQAVALRPMGLMEIVDQTFRLYRRNFWLFFGIAAWVYLPLGFLQGLVGERMQQAARAPLAGATPEVLMGDMLALVPLVVPLVLLAPLGYLVSSAALTKAVSDRYLGQAATIGRSYGYIARRLIPFILTLVVTYLFVAAGVILLIVGMIVFAFWAAFVTEIFVIEDKRYLRALWRGKFLVGGGVWAQVVALGLIVGVLSWLIQMTAGLPVQVAEGIGWKGGFLLLFIVALGTAIGSTLVMPIGIVSTVLLYYDSRIRKEGFDLELLARELRASLPAPPGPAPSAPAGPQASAPPGSGEGSG